MCWSCCVVYCLLGASSLYSSRRIGEKNILGAQAKRRSSACTLGKMEGGQAEQMKQNNVRGDPVLLGSSRADP